MSILFYKLFINNKNNIRAGGSPYPYIDIFLSMLYNKNYFNLNDNKLIIDTSLYKIQELKSITNNKCLYDITNIHNNDISLFNLFVKNINPFPENKQFTKLYMNTYEYLIKLCNKFDNLQQLIKYISTFNLLDKYHLNMYYTYNYSEKINRKSTPTSKIAENMFKDLSNESIEKENLIHQKINLIDSMISTNIFNNITSDLNKIFMELKNLIKQLLHDYSENTDLVLLCVNILKSVDNKDNYLFNKYYLILKKNINNNLKNEKEMINNIFKLSNIIYYDVDNKYMFIKSIYNLIHNPIYQNIINLYETIQKNNNIILVNYYYRHIMTFYIHKIGEKYNFYRVNSNQNPSILFKQYNNINKLYSMILTFSLISMEYQTENNEFYYGILQYDLADSYFNFDNSIIPFKNVTQEGGSCYFYSIMLSTILFLYLNIDTIKYKLYSDNKYEEILFDKKIFSSNEIYFILYRKKLPYIILLIMYYINNMYLQYLKIENIIDITNINSATYHNLLITSNNTIYKLYKELYNLCKVSNSPIDYKKMYHPKLFIQSLISKFNLIIKNKYKIKDYNYLELPTQDIFNNHYNNKIDYLYNFDYNYNNKWSISQVYKQMGKYINILLSDKYNSLNINRIKEDLKNNKILSPYLTHTDNFQKFTHKLVSNNRYKSNNAFIPFVYTYEQLLDIIHMHHTIIYDSTEILDFKKIIIQIFKGFNINYNKDNNIENDFDYDMIYEQLYAIYNNFRSKLKLFYQIVNTSINMRKFNDNLSNDADHILKIILNKNDIIKNRKIFIQRYIILFNLLNIKFTNEIFNMIDNFYILNLLSTLYISNNVLKIFKAAYQGIINYEQDGDMKYDSMFYKNKTIYNKLNNEYSIETNILSQDYYIINYCKCIMNYYYKFYNDINNITNIKNISDPLIQKLNEDDKLIMKDNLKYLISLLFVNNMTEFNTLFKKELLSINIQDEELNKYYKQIIIDIYEKEKTNSTLDIFKINIDIKKEKIEKNIKDDINRHNFIMKIIKLYKNILQKYTYIFNFKSYYISNKINKVKQISYNFDIMDYPCLNEIYKKILYLLNLEKDILFKNIKTYKKIINKLKSIIEDYYDNEQPETRDYDLTQLPYNIILGQIPNISRTSKIKKTELDKLYVIRTKYHDDDRIQYTNKSLEKDPTEEYSDEEYSDDEDFDDKNESLQKDKAKGTSLFTNGIGQTATIISSDSTQKPVIKRIKEQIDDTKEKSAKEKLQDFLTEYKISTEKIEYVNSYYTQLYNIELNCVYDILTKLYILKYFSVIINFIKKVDKYSDYNNIINYTQLTPSMSYDKLYPLLCSLKLLNPINNIYETEQNMNDTLKKYYLLYNNTNYYQNNNITTNIDDYITQSLQHYIDKILYYKNTYFIEPNRSYSRSIFSYFSMKIFKEYDMFTNMIYYIGVNGLKSLIVYDDKNLKLLKVLINDKFTNNYKIMYSLVDNIFIKLIEYMNNFIKYIENKEKRKELHDIITQNKTDIIQLFNIDISKYDTTLIKLINNNINNNFYFKKYCMNILQIYDEYIANNLQSEKIKIMLSTDPKNNYLLNGFNCVNLYLVSNFHSRILLPTIINTYNENYFYNNNVITSYSDNIIYNDNDIDYTNKIIYFKTYINNIFTIFTQIYNCFINCSSLDNIIKSDYINELKNIIINTNKINLFDVDRKFYNIHPLNGYTIKSNNYIPQYVFIKNIVSIYMYSLFSNKFDYSEISDRLLQIFSNIDNNIKLNYYDIPNKDYYIYQILLILQKNTPYDILKQFYDENNENYENKQKIFNFYLTNLLINDSTQSHYIILIVLYTLGLLNDDILLYPETRAKIFLKYHDNHDIFLLLKYNDDEKNKELNDIIQKLKEEYIKIIKNKTILNKIEQIPEIMKIPLICVDDININLDNKAIINYVNNESKLLIDKNMQEVLISDKLYDEYIIYNNNKYIIFNQIKTNIKFNDYIYENLFVNVYKKENNDIDIIINFIEKKMIDTNENIYFHFNKKSDKYILDSIMILNKIYNVVNFKEFNYDITLNIYYMPYNSLLLTNNNKYYILYGIYNNSSNYFKNALYILEHDKIQLKYKDIYDTHDIIKFNNYALIELNYNLLSFNVYNVNNYNSIIKTYNRLNCSYNDIINNMYYKHKNLNRIIQIKKEHIEPSSDLSKTYYTYILNKLSGYNYMNYKLYIAIDKEDEKKEKDPIIEKIKNIKYSTDKIKNQQIIDNKIKIIQNNIKISDIYSDYIVDIKNNNKNIMFNLKEYYKTLSSFNTISLLIYYYTTMFLNKFTMIKTLDINPEIKNYLLEIDNNINLNKLIIDDINKYLKLYLIDVNYYKKEEFILTEYYNYFTNIFKLISLYNEKKDVLNNFNSTILIYYLLSEIYNTKDNIQLINYYISIIYLYKISNDNIKYNIKIKDIYKKIPKSLDSLNNINLVLLKQLCNIFNINYKCNNYEDFIVIIKKINDEIKTETHEITLIPKTDETDELKELKEQIKNIFNLSEIKKVSKEDLQKLLQSQIINITNKIYDISFKLNVKYKEQFIYSIYDYLKNNIIEYYILLYYKSYSDDILNVFNSNINNVINKEDNTFINLSETLFNMCNRFNNFYNELSIINNIDKSKYYNIILNDYYLDKDKSITEDGSNIIYHIGSINKYVPYKILKINNNMNIKDIKEFDKLTEYEKDIWNIYYTKTQIRMFEIMFGHFIRQDQFELINNIYEELKKKDYYTVQNLIMGSGKSSVLTPILTMLMEQHNKPFILILPHHLVKDSIGIINQYRILFKRNIRYINDITDATNLIIDPQFNYILSDTQFKFWLINMYKYNTYIKGNPKIKNNLLINKILDQFYILYDEIDTIIDPIKSNFNKITKLNDIIQYIENKKNVLYNIYLQELLRLNLVEKDLINKMIDNNEYKNIYDFDLYESYEYIKTLIYNVNYGFSTYESHGNNFIGVPYEHVDKPINKSYFTKLSHTIIATLLCYVIIYNKKRIIDENIFVNVNSMNKYKYIKDDLQMIDEKELRYLFNNNIQMYFEYIIYSIQTNITQTIYYENITSTDIMDNVVSPLKTGYSGTVDFDLPIYYNIDKKYNIIKDAVNKNITEDMLINNNNIFNKIKKDDNSTKNIYAGLLGFPKLNEHNIYCYNSDYNNVISLYEEMDKFKDDKSKKLYNNIEPNDILRLCSLIEDGKLKYNALIDAGALLKNKSIINTVKDLYKCIYSELDKSIKYHIIFINENDEKMIYYKDITEKEQIKKFTYLEEDINYFYYYDNQHIVGVDIKQPLNIYGLITMTYYNSYTDIAQAAFRLRKLGKTHLIDYVLQNNIQNIDYKHKNYLDFLNNLIKFIHEKYDIYKLYKYILYYLLISNNIEQQDRLSYLFNQNVLYYYKQNNINNYLLCNDNDLFMYINKDNIKDSNDKDSIKGDVINNTYKVIPLKEQIYYKHIFYYTPFVKNGLKSFIINDEGNLIYNNTKNNSICKFLLNTKTYDILNNEYKHKIYIVDISINIDIDINKNKNKNKDKDLSININFDKNLRIPNYSFNLNYLNDIYGINYNNYEYCIYYYNKYNPNISVCIKKYNYIEGKKTYSNNYIIMELYQYLAHKNDDFTYDIINDNDDNIVLNILCGISLNNYSFIKYLTIYNNKQIIPINYDLYHDMALIYNNLIYKIDIYKENDMFIKYLIIKYIEYNKNRKYNYLSNLFIRNDNSHKKRIPLLLYDTSINKLISIIYDYKDPINKDKLTLYIKQLINDLILYNYNFSKETFNKIIDKYMRNLLK